MLVDTYNPSKPKIDNKTKSKLSIQILFWLNFCIFLAINLCIFFLSNFSSPKLLIIFAPIFLIVLTTNLYYFTNLLHLASHNLIAKNSKLNSFYGNVSAIFCGLTFAEFKTSHLLHHKNPANPEKDPDHLVSQSGSVFTLPFRVWLKDKYFWQNGYWKKRNLWLGYLINRFLQLSLVILAIFLDKFNIFSFFYLLPLFFVGMLNSLFLFYYPHYSNQFEENLQDKNNFFSKFALSCIDLSRKYHNNHHLFINNLVFYFPVEIKLKDWFSNLKNSFF